MTKDRYNEYFDKMADAYMCKDEEIAHSDADDILCDMLVELGYNGIVELYKKVDKWYA